MNNQELERRKDRAQTETFIVTKTDDGYRVYSPLAPANQWLVRDTGDDITCTCPDFQHHADDPEWRCKHIIAAEPHLNGENKRPDEGAAGAVASNGTPPPKEPPAPKKSSTRNSDASLTIKRSVSPDGRINSLSVEFSIPIAKGSIDEMKQQAEKALKVQSEVVEEFRKANPAPEPPPANGNGNGTNANGVHGNGTNGNGARIAQMLDIGGMNGKWGRRLFINVRADNQVLKYFGSEKQLGDALATAGYPNMANQVREGLGLNLACRVVTKPSPDGRYTNIDQLLPANGG